MEEHFQTLERFGRMEEAEDLAEILTTEMAETTITTEAEVAEQVIPVDPEHPMEVPVAQLAQQDPRELEGFWQLLSKGI